MAILSFFKKKKEEKEIEKQKKEEPFVKEPPEMKLKKEKVSREAFKILKSPHITEKASDLTKVNQYIFKVFPRANKTEIKKAVENLYGVNVISVKIINIPPKRRTLGRISGWRKGYKKAIVKIKEGQKIELLPR
jgi:large subunit ribosomal protein L23